MKAPLALSTHQNPLISGESAPALRGLHMDCLSAVVCSWEIVFLTVLSQTMASKTGCSFEVDPGAGFTVI